MLRTEFLNHVWEKGSIEVKELAVLLNTTTDIILMEAALFAEKGLVRILDSLIIATELTKSAGSLVHE